MGATSATVPRATYSIKSSTNSMTSKPRDLAKPNITLNAIPTPANASKGYLTKSLFESLEK